MLLCVPPAGTPNVVVIGGGIIPNVPVMISSVGMDVGANPTGVSDAYEAPFEFTGQIRRIEIETQRALRPDDEAAHESGMRGPGSYSHTSEHDVHMERGGPEGALVVFNLYAPDGLLAQTLSSDLVVLHTSTAAPIIERWKRHNPS